jgi:hypothetical protein
LARTATVFRHRWRAAQSLPTKRTSNDGKARKKQNRACLSSCCEHLRLSYWLSAGLSIYAVSVIKRQRF